MIIIRKTYIWRKYIFSNGNTYFGEKRKSQFWWQGSIVRSTERTNGWKGIPVKNFFSYLDGKHIKYKTKNKFTHTQRRGGNLQYCKREKQKRHIINFIISMIVLLCSFSPPQKKLFSFSKYFPSPNIVLLFLLRSSSPLQIKYYPPFPSVFFSSSANQNISFSILLLLFYCQHLHNKARSINKRFAFYT